VTISGATASGTGTVVVQAETPGSASFSNVTATGTGATGTYNCSYPANLPAFTINKGSGNSGWDGNWNDCSTWPQPGAGATGGTTGGSTGGSTTPPAGGNLSQGRPATASSTVQVYTAANAVDGNADTYWESASNAFPQSLTVDLGAAKQVGKVTLKLPPATAWATRTETLSVLGSTDNNNWSTLKASGGVTFNPSSGNTATLTFTAASVRYVRLNITANNGWPAGQISEFETYAS
jgi:hypothetical protein